MGNYINITEKGALGATFSDKITGLKEDGAVTIPEPTEWEEGLVCVIDNGRFAAAGHAYDKQEMESFIKGMDERPHVWMKYEKAKKYAN